MPFRPSASDAGHPQSDKFLWNFTHLCWNLTRYLHDESLRREINEGLNVVEQWNGATDFVFFTRRGEMASNRREDHEISMLALHLIQNCMVYINTLMIQRVLAQLHW